MASNRGRARIVLLDYQKKLEDRYIDIEGDDGNVLVSAMPTELWPDNVIELLMAGDMVTAATLILGGADEYTKFKASGGSANLLLAMLRDDSGLPLGESSASSGS